MKVVRPTLFLAAAAAAAFSALAGCSSSPSAPNPAAVADTILVDASASYAYIHFGSPIQQVTVADPTTSTAWDLGVFATGIKLNGGAAGPGGVTGYCLCQNETATDGQVEAMTAANQLAAFEAVTASQIPADNLFQSDVLVPSIEGWFTGTPPAVTAVSTNSWVIRYDAAGPRFAKIRVTSIVSPTATTAGQINFDFARQTTVGGAFTAVTSTTADVTGGPVYFDFNTGAVGSASAWSIEFTGYQIRVNGGVSGTGGVGAVIITSTPFASIDAAYVASIPSFVYSSDVFGGVFFTHKWYRYNLTGVDNQIWPVYNSYFIKRGAIVWKVQVTGYYNSTGTSRHVTFRSVQLTN